MTEEPYRWLEAVANRRDYVREQLKGGSPVFAACLPEGILLLGVGSGQSRPAASNQDLQDSPSDLSSV